MATSKQTFIIHLTIMNCAAMDTNLEAFVEISPVKDGRNQVSSALLDAHHSGVKISSMTMTVTRTKRMNIDLDLQR